MNSTLDKKKLVVIGNGMAGARTVEEILRRGGADQYDITVFGAEPHGNYNRILLSGVLSGTHDPKDIFLHTLDWYREHGITLRAGVKVEAIDRESKTVLTAEGERVPYDKLILATGSRPFIPPMEGLKLPDGSDKPGVFVFRTLDDCTRIAGYATKCRKVAVLGGGLLGLEAARGLLTHGAEVHVVHLMDRLMEQQLDPTAAGLLKSAMEKMGVYVHLEKATTEILGEKQVTGLAFRDGSTLECDMVVVSCGIRPNVELAKECGLTVERAVVVNDRMQSADDPDISVVGECAQHNGRVYGLVAPLWEQAQVLADVLTGRNPRAAYTGSKIATKLKVMGVELASMGITEAQEERDEVLHYTEAKRGTYKKVIIRDGKLVGAILLGDLYKSAYLMQAFDRGTPLPNERASLIFDIGAPTPQGGVQEMADEEKVCQCNGVSKGDIQRCIGRGGNTLPAIMEVTRAGTGCGTCKPMVLNLIELAQHSRETLQCETDCTPVLRVGDGEMTPLEQLRRLILLAEKYNVQSLKLPVGESIHFHGVREEDRFAIREELTEAGILA